MWAWYFISTLVLKIKGLSADCICTDKELLRKLIDIIAEIKYAILKALKNTEAWRQKKLESANEKLKINNYSTDSVTWICSLYIFNFVGKILNGKRKKHCF